MIIIILALALPAFAEPAPAPPAPTEPDAPTAATPDPAPGPSSPPGVTYPNTARRGGDGSFVRVPAAVEVLHRHDERRAGHLIRHINSSASPMRVRRLAADLADSYAGWASTPDQRRILEVVKFGKRFEVPIPEAPAGEPGR